MTELMTEPTRQPRWPHTTIEEQEGYITRGRIMLGSFVLTGPVLGLAIGNMAAQDSENADNAEYRRVVAGYERCIDVIEDQLKPGDTTITLKLSKISERLQDDCGIDAPFSLEETTDTNDPDSYDFKFPSATYGINTKFTITSDADVTLPPVATYEKEIAARREKAEFSHGQVAVETVGYGALGLMNGVAAFGIISERHFRRLERKAKERGMVKPAKG